MTDEDDDELAAAVLDAQASAEREAWRSYTWRVVWLVVSAVLTMATAILVFVAVILHWWVGAVLLLGAIVTQFAVMIVLLNLAEEASERWHQIESFR